MSTCGRRTTQTRRSGEPVARATRGRRRMAAGAAVAAALWLAVAAGAAAQEGHPLVGTWRGEWGPDAKQRHDLTFVMEFDGTAVTGVINPGFESMRLQKVALDPDTWTVRFETETKEPSGKVSPVVIEARFEDITNRHRSLVGTWTQGSTKGDFKVTLD